MKRMARSYWVVVTMVVLAVGCTSSGHHQMTFEPHNFDAQYWTTKVDRFVVIMDASQSMAAPSQREAKIDQASGLALSLNQSIPELGFVSGLRSFGKGKCVPKGATALLAGMSTYDTTAMNAAITDLSCTGGSSPLDRALTASAGDLQGFDQRGAVVIITDGLHMGKPEIAAARTLGERYGEDVCLYALQIGSDSRATRLLDQVVNATGCGSVSSAASLTSGVAMGELVEEIFLYPDSDADGVPNHLDKCPDTPQDVTVDTHGCPIDSDGDGVPDYLDKCPDTPEGVKVNDKGCPVDSDGDGVPDYLDKCPDTPKGASVDAKGCPIDSDGDGVPDYRDKCPDTPRGVPVDAHGCPIAGITVHGDEWSVDGKVLFDLNKADIKDEAGAVLDRVAAFLLKNRKYVVEIQGHTDSTGPMQYNMKLSERRAASVKDYLVGRGVSAARFTVKGFGPHEPLVENDTAANRALNRRVDFRPSER